VRTTVSLRREVKERLDELKAVYRARTYDTLFLLLLRELEECARLRAEARVRELMCNEMAESRATLPAWGRILTSRLRDPDLVSAALGYLVQDPQDPEVLVVDRRRCGQGP
jgi:hypothetical protein